LERETFHDRPGNWVSSTKMPLRDERGQIIGTFGISRDVTAQIKAEKALAYQVLHDPVTDLANRAALMDRLSQAPAALERQPGRLAVLYVDLDHFKAINDSFGHDAGDHRVHERRDPTSREGMDLDQLFVEKLEAELLAKHTDESETRVGHCVIVVEHHRQARRAVRR
jgi:hypothetical protein